MKTAIIIFLVIIVVLETVALYLLFQPNATYQASRPSVFSQEAAVGRAVMDAARRDPAVAVVLRGAVQGASEKDRMLAANLIVTLPAP